jgi:hypothetical protein
VRRRGETRTGFYWLFPEDRHDWIVFVVIWFFVAAANLWVGVSKAGYAYTEELPIFLLIFLLPAVVAVVIRWKWL